MLLNHFPLSLWDLLGFNYRESMGSIATTAPYYPLSRNNRDSVAWLCPPASDCCHFTSKIANGKLHWGKIVSPIVSATIIGRENTPLWTLRKHQYSATTVCHVLHLDYIINKLLLVPHFHWIWIKWADSYWQSVTLGNWVILVNQAVSIWLMQLISSD